MTTSYSDTFHHTQLCHSTCWALHVQRGIFRVQLCDRRPETAQRTFAVEKGDTTVDAFNAC